MPRPQPGSEEARRLSTLGVAARLRNMHLRKAEEYIDGLVAIAPDLRPDQVQRLQSIFGGAK